MFQNIQKIFRSLTKRTSFFVSRNGQTSIVLVLMIAIALIIYSISLNWGRVTQYKTMTTIGSNTAAAHMASMIASHGEYQMQTTLGGRVQYCKRTYFIILVIVVVVAIVLTIVAPAGAPTYWAIAAAVFASAALIIHVTVIEPGLTKMWNRMQQNLPLDGQIIESAIMTGMTATVSDQSRISDHFDMDGDGIWVNESDTSNVSNVTEKHSRFAYYYTRRLQSISAANIVEIRLFVDGIRELLFDNPYGKVGAACTPLEQATGSIRCQIPDDFGIFDPGCNNGLPSPYCDPCCLPPFESDGVTPLRPATCDAVDVNGNPIPIVCADGEYPTTTYPYQYDPSYENYGNTFRSFREELGVDDENEFFIRNKFNPNNPPPQTLFGNQFNREDPTGYWTGTQQNLEGLSPAVPDNRRGVFPFFWKMSLFPPANPLDAKPLLSIPALPRADRVVMITADPTTCTSLTTCPNKLVTPPDQCSATLGYDTVTQGPKMDGFYWKPGSDQYCSNEYPYNDCVGRIGNCTEGTFNTAIPVCGCQASDNPALWHDDIQDAMVQLLKDFSLWADNFIKSDMNNLNKDFVTWYPQAAYWISPRCPEAAKCNDPLPADPVTCRFCNNTVNNGVLILLRDLLGSWVDLLDTWLYKTTFASDDTFCLPTSGANFTTDERNDIPSLNPGTPVPTDRTGTNMPPIWGDLNDTIACLNYNSTNVATLTACQTKCLATPTDYTGNANVCLNLPRSVYDLKNSNTADVARNTNYQNAQLLQNCLDSACDDPAGNVLAVCTLLPGVGIPPDCAGFPGNAFGTAVRNERDNQFKLSNYCEPAAPAPTTPFQDMLVRAIDAATSQSQGVDGINNRLSALIDLRSHAWDTRQIFFEGYDKINEFLRPCNPGDELGEGCDNCVNGGPAARLICARKNYDSTGTNFAIYGWQSKPVSGRGASGTDPDKGYWHLVRVEAFAPQRCFGQCRSEYLPWVSTGMMAGRFTNPNPLDPGMIFSGFGGFLNRKRCYTLTNTDGIVIARVTRYDEDRDSPGVRFANNQFLWNFRFSNPTVSSVTTPGNILAVDCRHPQGYDIGVSPSTKQELDGAFMINYRPNQDSLVNPSCWTTVNQLLARGVQTTTCAKYYYDDAIKHMSLKFTSCDQGAVDTATSCAASGLCQ